jgi:hypothetical protein
MRLRAAARGMESKALDGFEPIVTLCNIAARPQGSNSMAKKQKKRGKPAKPEPRWRTVRVSVETLERIDLIARGLNRPLSFVVSEAIGAYAIIQDLNSQSQIGRRLEVRA